MTEEHGRKRTHRFGRKVSSITYCAMMKVTHKNGNMSAEIQFVQALFTAGKIGLIRARSSISTARDCSHRPVGGLRYEKQFPCVGRRTAPWLQQWWIFSLALSPLVALKQIFERSENNSTSAAGTVKFRLTSRWPSVCFFRI